MSNVRGRFEIERDRHGLMCSRLVEVGECFTVVDAVLYDEAVAERDRLREALQKVAEQVCTCVGYYKCNGCESRIAQMAEAALLEQSRDGE